MRKDRYMNAKEAAETLDISLATLYAYVSRGIIRSEPVGENKRERRYYAEDVEKLLARREGRRNPEKLAQDALHWGAPVMESAITLIDGGRLYYRGRDVSELVQKATIEDVATLIWTDELVDARKLFDLDVHVSAIKYETMLLHVEVDGADLTTVQALSTFLPIAAADDDSAYDLRPMAVATTGARILRLMTSVAAGDVPENVSIAQMLQIGWTPDDDKAVKLLNTALILCADHELNASSFTARVVASAGASPYAVVIAGLAALQGSKHGGHTERVQAMMQEAQRPEMMRQVIANRLRRGDPIPGFGHRLYPDGDPRARILLNMLRQQYGNTPSIAYINALIQSAAELIDEAPTLDVALVALSYALKLPEDAPLAIFALGRTIGWLGHAIEQYETDRMIRPRARYTGAHPYE